MKVILGSRNKAKIKAVEDVTDRFYSKFKLEAVDVDAPDQPMSIGEARKGAKSRAHQAYKNYKNALGIGVEGYVERIDGKVFPSVWSAVFNGKDFFEGGGGRSRLPEKISEKLEEKELGEAIKELMGEDLREGKGGVSLLTDGEIGRPEFTERSLIHAFGNMENRWGLKK